MTTAGALSTAGQRLYCLDAMRGIAAIVVFLYHAEPYVHLQLTGSAYLAVDFFFALSGYVVARAYGQRLGATLSRRRFVNIRLTRLYPLFALGVLLGTVRALAQMVVQDAQAPTGAELAGQLVLNSLVLPYPSASSGLFPLNGPAWSLFFEFVINLVFAAWLFRAPGRWLVVIGGLAAAALVVGAMQHQSLNIGWNWPTLPYGFARSGYGFIAGMLLARWDGVHAPRVRTGALAAAPLVVLGAVLLLEPGDGLRPYWDLLGALVLSPALVFAGARCGLGGFAARISSAAGDLSYPLYAIHFPVILIFAFVIGLTTSDSAALLTGITAGVLAAAAAATWAFDAPLRARLARGRLERGVT